MADQTKTATCAVTGDELLQQWQGHRRLTRRTIEAFPEDKLFHFSIGGMRSFGEMARELLGMAVPVLRGLATGAWKTFEHQPTATKADLLRLWDEQTVQMEEWFHKVPEEAYRNQVVLFGQWPMAGVTGVLYAIDNEVHHRGEAFVYLRALGIEPPSFYVRD